MSAKNPLTSPHTAVVFAHALTGLGHLRVSHALYHGLPTGSHPYLLNSQDESINVLHRLMSVHPWLRTVMERTQSGWLEDVIAYTSRIYFRRHTSILRQQLQTIVDEHPIKPKTLLVVATHTLLGHQLSAIKESFARANWLTMILIVIVTDDSPQHVWAVGGADIIVVPSDYTKRNLERYHGTQKDMRHALYIVDPYMVSPRFGAPLPDDWFTRKVHSLDPNKLAPIHISIPVSGAAVQLSYFEKLISNLDRLSNRLEYHITSQQSPSTIRFLNSMIGRKNISLNVSSSHREVVDLYEKLLDEHLISLEVTKPSEQAFKALCAPTQRGGVLLLFSEPVGRQEYDNLHFLRRHGLIPLKHEVLALWRAAARNEPATPEFLEKAHQWRGILLPSQPDSSARFIDWCLRERIFVSMVRFSGYRHHHEISSKGVETFWTQMSQYLISASV